MAGSLKTRDYYLACRYDQKILPSLIETARYKGATIQEVCDTLGIELSDEQVAQLKEMGYETR
jgi:hypothetical protein